MKDENAVPSCIGIVLGTALIVGMTALRGYTVSLLWQWFAVPLLDLPSLTMWQAYAISLIFSALQGWQKTGSEDETKSIVAMDLAKGIVFHITLIAIGLIIRPLI